MNASHPQALQAFVRKVRFLLLFREALRWVSAWLFLWGAIVLALRIAGQPAGGWPAAGLLGCLPAALAAVMQARRGLPAFAHLRANYDRLNTCGGVIMAAEAADMSAWESHLPAPAVPGLRWRGRRTWLLLGLAALVAATTLWLPDRLTRLASRRTLEIGKVVGELQAEVKTLAQERILDDKKADALEKELSRLQKDSNSTDPGKTWEALDHIKEADANTAQLAAEEAIKKTAALAQAQTLAQAMQQAADSGMSDATAAAAAADLESLLNAAKLEEGVLKGQIPPELLKGLTGLNKEQMSRLMKALQANKDALNGTMSDLARLKMIDADTLAKCLGAGTGGDPGALADYLSHCQGGGDPDLLFSWLAHPGKGGPGGGGPAAPMTWQDQVSEKDTKYQPHALPPAGKLDNAQLVGVSRTAPKVNADAPATAAGALDQAAGSGGSAQIQTVLPEQRAAVQSFFKRDQ